MERRCGAMYNILYKQTGGLMDKIASISDVRARLPEIVSLIEKKKRTRYVITRGGKPAAVILSPEELETLEILADKKLMLSLLKAEEDVRAGRIVSYEDVFR